MALDTQRPLPVLPLRNQPVLPGSRASIEVARGPSRALLESLRAGFSATENPLVVLVAQRDPATESYPSPSELPSVGVAARILSGDVDARGRCFIGVEALARVRIRGVVSASPFLTVLVEPASPPADATPGVEALHRRVRERALRQLGGLDPATRSAVELGADAGLAADLLGSAIPGARATKVGLSETLDPAARLREVERLLDAEAARQKGMEAAAARAPAELEQLWPLRPDGPERLRQALASGRISPDEAGRISDFVENGYVIWERLIPPDAVDALVSDVRAIRELPGCFVTTDHRRGRPFRFSGPDFDAFESIFDTYVNFESARRVCFHPTILRFLEVLFEARPIAFQQLLFQRSNGHALHQDTAYVCAEHPLQVVATWIALEDVVPGRGELTYYEGSHRIPGIRFADGSKRFNDDHDDDEAMLRELHGQLERQRCRKHDFIAKKGDVFLWAADLVHGSNPRTRPEEETRLSCVTHYCPETNTPLSFLMFPEHAGLQAWGPRALIASSHYVLPSPAAPARPVLDHALPA